MLKVLLSLPPLQIPQHFKDVNLVGLAWDDETGRFFVAQSRPPAVWSVAEGTPPVLLFTGAELPLEDISGMTHNRQTNSLLLVSSQDRVVVETSLTGELIGTMALASSQAQAGGPLAIAVAGGGKVMFLLSSTGHMEIFSVVQC